MSQLKVLVWKECRTLKVVWIAGFLLFYGLGAAHFFYRSGIFGGFPSQSVGGISLCLGAFYCVILAISLIGRDFLRPTEFFWRSRPIPLFGVVAIKYILGLLTVFLISFVPLALALFLESHPQVSQSDHWLFHRIVIFEFHILCYHTFTLYLVFSICFLIAALVRKAVETALLSFAAILIIYFFPVVFPPLESVSVVNLINSWDSSVGLFKTSALHAGFPGSSLGSFDHHVTFLSMVFAFDQAWWVFAFTMISLSMLSFIAASWVLSRNWSSSLGQKSLAWSLAGVSLLLFGAASFDVGTNLECERVIRSTQERRVEEIAHKDGKGILVYQTNNQGSDPKRLGFQEFDLNEEDVYGSSVEDPWIVGRGGIRYGNISYSWDEKAPHRVHYIARDVTSTVSPDGSRLTMLRKNLALATVDFEGPDSVPRISRVDLKPLMVKNLDAFIEPNFIPGITQTDSRSLVLNLSNDRHLYRFDLSDSTSPEPDAMVSEELFGTNFNLGSLGEVATATLSLPGIPGISSTERLRAWSDLQERRQEAVSDRFYVRAGRHGGTVIYRLVSLDKEEAVFERTGRTAESPVERLVNTGVRRYTLIDSYLVRIYSGGLTVYDLTDPSRPVRVGHYRSGIDQITTVAPLDDGRILAAGNHLHVIRLPKKGPV